MRKLLKELCYFDDSGFTLIELMVVIVIIGVLTAIAIPTYGKVQESASNRAHIANVRRLEEAALTAIATEGLPVGKDIIWTSKESNSENDTHKAEDYIDKWPNLPKGATNIGENDKSAEGYTITIKEDGNIEITPVVVDTKTHSAEI
mgnify:FL=1